MNEKKRNRYKYEYWLVQIFIDTLCTFQPYNNPITFLNKKC